MQVATIVESDLKAAVYQTLRYFALFRYPLNIAELFRYCGKSCGMEELSVCLVEMRNGGDVYCLEGHYALSPDIELWLSRRHRGNEKASKDMPDARRIARLIYQFPFVEFVGISGSLSKGFSDDRTDYDYFIITRENRLWISRTALHLFKKITFLLGQQHKFCMNYFLETKHLKLEEQNVYTATELSSLIPVCGFSWYEALMRENAWLHTFLPNQSLCKEGADWPRRSFLSAALDGILNLVFPAALNRKLMNITDAKWRRKWARKGYPAEDYDLAFKTKLYVSKNHPANYQKKILKELARSPD